MCKMHIYIELLFMISKTGRESMTTIQTREGAAPENACQDTVLVRMLNRLLLPLARLCLAHGITFATVEELLKNAFVQEADALEPDAPAYGAVSRISTATGLTRREVTRLIKSETAARPTKPPISTEVFARWTTDARYLDQDGAPRTLKRQGQESSFESLAQSVTRDVHPRSMLDELVRLGLACFDKELDCVTLTRNEFVPKGDSRQMIDLLSDNVGDHLDAAVTNVLQDGNRHQEQAVFADELSTESIKSLHTMIASRWKALRDGLVPAIIEMIAADRLAGRPQDQRIRIGLYSFDESTSGAQTTVNKAASPAQKDARK